MPDIVHGKIVGAGERLVIRILKELVPHAKILHQVDLMDLLPSIDYTQEPFLKNMRQEKESVDIVIVPSALKKISEIRNDVARVLCVRVQNIDHKGDRMSEIDSRQRRELRYHYKVIDIRWDEAEEVFAERYNEKSILEVKQAFQKEKLNLETLDCSVYK